jgi:hypothetical protein
MGFVASTRMALLERTRNNSYTWGLRDVSFGVKSEVISIRWLGVRASGLLQQFFGAREKSFGFGF